MTNITLPGVLAAFTFELTSTPAEMSTSSPSPGTTPVVIANDDLVFGGFPTFDHETLGVPGGVPVEIPNPQSQYLGGLTGANPNAKLVIGGLSFSTINHVLVPGGLPLVNHNPGVTSGLAIGSSTEFVLPGGTPFTVPPELIGEGTEQYLGDNTTSINGVSKRVISPGNVPVVIH